MRCGTGGSPKGIPRRGRPSRPSSPPRDTRSRSPASPPSREPAVTAAARLTPVEAVDLLARRYDEAVVALRGAVERFLRTGVPPSAEERAKFRYPRLRVAYHPDGSPPANPRAFAKFSVPGVYSTTVTQPADFRTYLLEQ